MTVRLAQVNISRMRYPVGSPRLAEFIAALDRINLLAERSPGFVWRYEAETGHLNGAELLGDPQAVVNLSGPTTALWWVPSGHLPTPAEAVARHRHLLAYGPTPRAFGVRSRFTPDGRLSRRSPGTPRSRSR